MIHSKVCGTTGVIVSAHTSLCCDPILTYGSEEQKQKYLIPLAKGEKLGAFAENAFKNAYLDLLPREGKVGGGFCEDIHSIKQSRILINFGGTINDVLTIAHELGHAYHSSLLYNNSELNAFYTMPIAETASNFCENIILNKISPNPEVKEADFQNITQSLVDIYSRFLFEDSVFNGLEEGFLSPGEINRLMLDAQHKTYGDGLNTYHKYMWICKPHYYDADFNYYNFPYTFGLLLSKALYNKYKNDGESFLDIYDRVFASTGDNNISESVKIAGIDIEDVSFWENTINEILIY